jgi:hypothetical protein
MLQRTDDAPHVLERHLEDWGAGRRLPGSL